MHWGNDMHGGDIYSHKIKHDFSININPLGLSLSGKIAYLRALKKISNYPDQNCGALAYALSKRLGVSAERLVFGNGASELIQALLSAQKARKVLLFAPCFTGYERAIKACDATPIYFYLNEKADFSFDEGNFPQLADVFKSEKPDFVIFTNPNNPNGRLFDGKTVDKIIQLCVKNDAKLLIDECFIELSGSENRFSSVIETSDSKKGIYIIRAFTKTYSIPGLRLGYCLCPDNNSADILKLKLPEWNVSSVAQYVGVTLLKTRYLQKARKMISRECKYLTEELKVLGFKVYNSDVNFILIKETSKQEDDSASLYKELLARGILIRDCSDYEGLGQGFYRVAVKIHKKNRLLIKSIKKVRGK